MKLIREFLLFSWAKGQKIKNKPGNNVIVKTWLDGSVHIFKKGVELEFREIINQSLRQIALTFLK